MVSIIDLWLPVLISAVAVFMISSVIHMVLPLHKGDYQKLPSEDSILKSMRDAGVGRGDYIFPCPESMKDMGSPEMVAKRQQGPVGFMTVVPSGEFAMGKCLGQWFALSIAISVIAGYSATIGLQVGASSMDVFRLTFLIPFAGYGVTAVQNSIWRGVPWIITGKFLIDGLLYAIATAASFTMFWPKA